MNTASERPLTNKKYSRMPSEIFGDVLGYLERCDIDAHQAACGQLRDLVNSLNMKLPLHCIQVKFSSSFLEDDVSRQSCEAAVFK